MLRPLAAAAAALLGAAAPAAAAPWSRPVTVMPALRAGQHPFNTQSGKVALEPAVAVRADGTATVVWTSRAPRRGFVVVRLAIRPPEGRWSAPHTIGESKGIPLAGAALSVAGSATAVAWSARQHALDPPRVVVWSRRSAGSRVAVDGPATGEPTFTPAVVVGRGGDLLAVWQQCACPRRSIVGLRSTLWWAVRTPDGGWSAPALLDPAPFFSALWLAGAQSGAALLAWAEPPRPIGSPVGPPPYPPPPPQLGLHLATRAPGGGLMVGEAITSPGGDLTLVLRPDGAPAIVGAGYDGVFARSWTSAGWGAAARVAVAPPGRIGSRPASIAALSDGRLVAAWTNAADARVRLYAAAETAPGGSWTSPALFASSGRGFGRPALASGPAGSAALAWSDGADGRIRSRVLRRGSWGPVTAISPAGVRCILPEAAIGADGRAVVAFVCGEARPSLLVVERDLG